MSWIDIRLCIIPHTRPGKLRVLCMWPSPSQHSDTPRFCLVLKEAVEDTRAKILKYRKRQREAQSSSRASQA